MLYYNPASSVLIRLTIIAGILVGVGLFLQLIALSGNPIKDARFIEFSKKYENVTTKDFFKACSPFVEQTQLRAFGSGLVLGSVIFNIICIYYLKRQRIRIIRVKEKRWS
jgi:hypothetical protein